MPNHKQKSEPYVAISIRVPRRELEQIDKVAKQTGLTRSALLRLAFAGGRQYLMEKFEPTA